VPAPGGTCRDARPELRGESASASTAACHGSRIALDFADVCHRVLRGTLNAVLERETMRHAFQRKLPITLLILVALEVSSSSVQAERWAKKPDGQWSAVEPQREQPSIFEADARVRLIGVTLLAGIPEGMAAGISIHPATNLLHLDLAVTGSLSLGVRAGVTFDPFDWVLAPTLTLAGGYSASATIPSTTTQYELYYVNIQPGLELGRRSRFRLFLRAGYSRFWVAGRSPGTFRGLETTSQPNVRINLFPSVNLGLTGYFGT